MIMTFWYFRLNCPDKPKTLKDFLIHVNKMTDEEFLNLRSFIVKGKKFNLIPEYMQGTSAFTF